jgi:uncharacterized repeat protein (TIGR03847 family)
MPVYTYDQPERFVAGAVGQPGDRAFYLQARAAGRLTSVSCEKVQVAALAERLDELLDEVLRRGGGQVPAVTPADLRDDDPLEQPIMADFRAGTIALAWDSEGEVVVIECESADAETDPESLEEPGSAEDDRLLSETGDADVLRVRIGPAAARAFAERALKLVASGRPPCPLCGLPLDSEGHVCPRQNGYRGGASA